MRRTVAMLLMAACGTVAVLAVQRLGNAWPTVAADGPAVGRLTARAVEERAALLGPAIRASVADRQAVIMVYESLGPRGPRMLWDAVCGDTGQHESVRLVWEAATGDLTYASSLGPPERPVPATPLQSVECVRRARHWMRTLGISRQAPRWQLAEPPVHVGCVWRVRWTAADRWAVVVLRDRTGELAVAYTSRQFTVAPGVAPRASERR